MASIINKIFGQDKKILKRLEQKAQKVDALKDDYRKLSDEELKAKTVEFKERLANGETLDDILVEAFATAREACVRVVNMEPFFVQIVGAISIHEGDIAEMKTGEGKTLTSVMPAYLNGLGGEGVHIVTVNDYLAGRDAREMGEIHRFLGLSVGLNHRGLNEREKREQFMCDITYTTNSEVGFDYLRDNMVKSMEQKVLRPLNYAIIDEVDSILIDEARTPLIISGGQKNTANLYMQTDGFVKGLTIDEDYVVDVKSQAASLTEAGVEKAERKFGIKNLYDLEHTALVHHINQALKANYIMTKDVEYMVVEGEIMIIDQFTGRLMEGRAYSDGLHQAIEAKEGVKIKQETVTLATITYQNYFRLYKKLSGMTGTAKTEEEEFRTIYNMRVVEVPTNREVIRVDASDYVFSRKAYKFKAMIEEVKQLNERGQPILIGTISVETSEEVSKLLQKERIRHEILNAKNHEREAEIIAKAGVRGSVTIATNMAGRGTDIKLGPGVVELGGLAVIGTERHESRRIDNQLRGRSGRQGDPGYSRFYVSFEDDLMVRFGQDRFIKMMESATGEEAIEMKAMAKSIESAQRRVEGNNFDSRKHILEYDDVLRQQREMIYEQRDMILASENIHHTIEDMFKRFSENLVQVHTDAGRSGNVQVDELVKVLNDTYIKFDKLGSQDITTEGNKQEMIASKVASLLMADYMRKFDQAPLEAIESFEKTVMLSILDNHWIDHIDTMTKLRNGIHLRAYAQKNPLDEYTEEAFVLFENMIKSIAQQVVFNLVNIRVVLQQESQV